MSYILDALRKAEAERERGALPGLHTQAGTPVPVEPRLLGDIPPWTRWLIALLVLALVAGVASLRTGGSVAPIDEAARSRPAPLPATAADAPRLPPAAPLRAAPATTPTAPAEPPASLAGGPTAVGVPPRVGERGDRSERAIAAPPPAPSSTAGASAATAVSSPGAGPSAVGMATAIAPPPDGRIHALDELPAEIRRELPSLTFGGLIQLEDPPRRSLIINGAIYMEGDLVQPHLLLEQIRLGAAVLRYKGFRYQLAI